MEKVTLLNKLLITSIPSVSDSVNASVLKDILNLKQCKIPPRLLFHCSVQY